MNLSDAAKLLGSKGGQSTSPKKQQASRLNGKLGGRKSYLALEAEIKLLKESIHEPLNYTPPVHPTYLDLVAELAFLKQIR